MFETLTEFEIVAIFCGFFFCFTLGLIVGQKTVKRENKAIEIFKEKSVRDNIKGRVIACRNQP